MVQGAVVGGMHGCGGGWVLWDWREWCRWGGTHLGVVDVLIHHVRGASRLLAAAAAGVRVEGHMWEELHDGVLWACAVGGCGVGMWCLLQQLVHGLCAQRWDGCSRHGVSGVVGRTAMTCMLSVVLLAVCS